MSRKITASYLYEHSKKKMADIIVQDQSRVIDYKLLEHNEIGLGSLTYQLPSTFDIENMSYEDSKIYIYSEIVKNYQNRGFSVQLVLNDINSMIILGWVNGMTKDERHIRSSIIQECVIKFIEKPKNN
jgi:hypothetical protein